MYPLTTNLHVKDLFDTTLEFFSALRSPSSSSNIQNYYLPDPRGWRSPEASGREADELCSNASSSGQCPPASEINCTGSDIALDSSSSKEISRLRSELKLLREKHYALQTTLRDTQQQVRQKDTQIQQLRERNRKLEAEQQETQRLADERKLEVKSLEKFLTKTDEWAGSDFVQTVKDMNSEILQFSTAASESLVTEYKFVQNGPGRRKALDRVAARFGSKMRNCLEKRDHSQDPTILQYALQACLCQCISNALSSFCFGSSGKLESHLSRIYSHMHSTESQPTSARWRALAHSHIRTLTPNIDELAINEVTDSCSRGIANLFAAAGFGDVDDHHEMVEAKYNSQLQRIAEIASKLALVIREGTMSTDFRVVFVDSARDFSSSTMENLYEGYGSSQGRILCTTEIGLQCVTNRGKEGKEGREFNEHTVEKRILLKPRVVLDSVVHILDR